MFSFKADIPTRPVKNFFIPKLYGQGFEKIHNYILLINTTYGRHNQNGSMLMSALKQKYQTQTAQKRTVMI